MALFWTLLELPGLERLIEIADAEITSLLILLIELQGAANYFDDSLLKDAPFTVLCRYLRKGNFPLEHLVLALQHIFRDEAGDDKK